VLARAGLRLVGPVHRNGAELHQPHFLSGLHHLDEQLAKLREVALTKVGNRTMGREVVGTQYPVRHVFMQRRGDLPGRKRPRGVGVHQHLQHHAWIEGLFAWTLVPVARLEFAQVHRINGIGNEERQMIFRQPITKRRRQKQRLIGLGTSKFTRHDPV
jgi:hypothetical protein